jgi:hypothetical protein
MVKISWFWNWVAKNGLHSKYIGKTLNLSWVMICKVNSILSLLVTQKMAFLARGTQSKQGSFRCMIPPYTTIWKGLVWKDPTIEINCIPLKLALVVWWCIWVV